MVRSGRGRREAPGRVPWRSVPHTLARVPARGGRTAAGRPGTGVGEATADDAFPSELETVAAAPGEGAETTAPTAAPLRGGGASASPVGAPLPAERAAPVGESGGPHPEDGAPTGAGAVGDRRAAPGSSPRGTSVPAPPGCAGSRPSVSPSPRASHHDPDDPVRTGPQSPPARPTAADCPTRRIEPPEPAARAGGVAGAPPSTPD